MQVSTYSRNHLYTAVCIVISRCEELSKQKKSSSTLKKIKNRKEKIQSQIIGD